MKKIFIISTAITVILFVSAAVYYAKSPEVFNCCIVSISGKFEKSDKYNLFISKDTPYTVKDSILSILQDADKRVYKYWESSKRKGNPTIIFCYSDSLLADYTSGNNILSYITPFKDIIAFGKNAINLDMLSHEMFHTELAARVGYLNTTMEIPVWFNEGLAMQVDYREEYSERKYQEVKDLPQMKIELNKIKDQSFYTGDFYYHFIFARHEISSWINKVGKDGLFTLINELNNGKDFYDVYDKLLSDNYLSPQ